MLDSQCYRPLELATNGLLQYQGTIGIATQGIIDLPCITSIPDWREIIQFTSYLTRSFSDQREL